MEYWQGVMNWSLREDWSCAVCGTRDMTWGLTHAQCRCDNCHAVYYMRDEDSEIVDIPIDGLEPEYSDAFKLIWEASKTPFSEVSDEIWDQYITSKVA